jgi:hypothetical protein
MTFFIVTYATHERGYFKTLKQSCPDIVVLGMGTQWQGFRDKVNGVMEFCRSRPPNDIVCFVDGFDSVVLDASTLCDKFKAFDADLVFSHDSTTASFATKYIQDKLFGKCQDQRLNSGMYVGYTHAICTFWEGMQSGQDDQTFATHQCRTAHHNLAIDASRTLFYNYSAADDIRIVERRLTVDHHTPCVISGPNHKNMNHILAPLGYTDLPDIQVDVRYRIRTYIGAFAPEIVGILLVVGVLGRYGVHWRTVVASVLFLVEIGHYELYIKHLDASPWFKALYLVLDVFHMGIISLVLYLLTNYTCDLRKLLFLNVLYGCILIQFFILRQCCISMLENWVLGIDASTRYMGLGQRIQYLYDIHKEYVPDKGDNASAWMRGNILPLTGVILLNLHCLYKMTRNPKGPRIVKYT